MNNKFLIPWKSSDLCAGLLTIVLAIMPGVAFCQSKDSATSKQQPWGETPAFEQKTRKLTAPNMKTFFSTYCLRCHGPEESEGGFRADRLAPQIGAVQDIEHWKSVLDVLVTGDMPPEDEVQPQSTELLAAIEQLESFVRDSRGAFLGDGINRSVRRLNQREYANVIDDLLGIELPLDLVPADDSVGDFDTHAETLSLSSMLLKQYFVVGRRAIDLALDPYSLDAKTQVETLEPEVERIDFAKAHGPRLEQAVASLKQWNDIKKRKGIKGLAKSKGFADIKIARRMLNNKQYKSIYSPWRDYLKMPLATGGAIVIPLHVEIPFDIEAVGFKGLKGKPTGKYKFRVHCGKLPGIGDDLAFMRVSSGEHVFGEFPVVTTAPETHVVEISLFHNRKDSDHDLVDFRFVHDFNKGEQAEQLENLTAETAYGIWIDKIELEGPIHDDSSSPVTQAVFPPHLKMMTFQDEDVSAILTHFAAKAFRGKTPSDTYITQLCDIYETEKNRLGKDTAVNRILALKLPLSIVLASPNFIYLSESDGRGRVNDQELSLRLSLLLWGGLPDARLEQLAKRDKLHEDSQLIEEVDRMIDDLRFQNFIDGFVKQWLELGRIEGINVDRKRFPEFTSGVKAAAVQEPGEFVKHLFRKDLSLKNLVRSDFAVVNTPLAEFYDLPPLSKPGFQSVPLPADTVRGGLLSQSALLNMTTNGDRTSPVQRGAYILEKFMDWNEMVPPPNVPSLTVDNGQVLETVRESLSMHSQVTQCAVCHRHIDPLGFGLENFDVIGKWRDDEVIDSVVSEPPAPTAGAKQLSRRERLKLQVVTNVTRPIDPSGSLPRGEGNFSGYRELQDRLLQDPDRLVRTLAKAILSYSLGRQMTVMDDDAIKEITDYVATHDYSARSLLHAIVLSSSFHNK